MFNERTVFVFILNLVRNCKNVNYYDSVQLHSNSNMDLLLHVNCKNVLSITCDDKQIIDLMFFSYMKTFRLVLKTKFIEIVS